MTPLPLILSDTDFQPLVGNAATIVGAIDALERATRLLADGAVRQAELEDRTSGAGGPVNLMQIRFAAADDLAAGYQVFAEEASGDAPTLPNARFVTLLHAQTRQLVAVMGYQALAPLRVSATAGLACRYLAPQGATTLAMIGSGLQARAQIPGVLAEVPTLKQVLVYSPTVAHREAFAKEVAGTLGVAVRAVDSAQQAVADADIVDVASAGYQQAIELEWVKPGALVMPIGTRQMPASVLQGHRILSTTWEHLRAREPYRTAIREGRFTREQTLGELADVVAGRLAPRRSPADTLVFELGRINIWDVAICQWAYQWALAHNVGTAFSLG